MELIKQVWKVAAFRFAPISHFLKNRQNININRYSLTQICLDLLVFNAIEWPFYIYELVNMNTPIEYLDSQIFSQAYWDCLLIVKSMFVQLSILSPKKQILFLIKQIEYFQNQIDDSKVGLNVNWEQTVMKYLIIVSLTI